MNTEKQIIEKITDNVSTSYGPYETARRIVDRRFNNPQNTNLAYQVNRTYYSVLSVVRRHLAKQTAKLQHAMA